MVGRGGGGGGHFRAGNRWLCLGKLLKYETRGQGVSKGKFHCFIWVSLDHQMRGCHGRHNPAGWKSQETMWETKCHRRVISISREKKQNKRPRYTRRDHDQKLGSMLRWCKTPTMADLCSPCPRLSQNSLQRGPQPPVSQPPGIQTQFLISSPLLSSDTSPPHPHPRHRRKLLHERGPAFPPMSCIPPYYTLKLCLASPLHPPCPSQSRAEGHCPAVLTKQRGTAVRGPEAWLVHNDLQME